MKKKYYLTDLSPKTPNSNLQRAISGSRSSITSDSSQGQIRGQGYLELNVDGRQLKFTTSYHVSYISAILSNLIFELIECGQRLDLQSGKHSS